MSKLECDFCGAVDSADNPVISGDNACICKSCVNAAHEIMMGNDDDNENKISHSIPREAFEIKTPAQLKDKSWLKAGLFKTYKIEGKPIVAFIKNPRDTFPSIVSE